MSMDDVSGRIDELIALSVVVLGLAAAYAKSFSRYQTTLSQWVIDACGIPSRWRGLTNLAVGLAIAAGFSVIAAMMLDAWALVAVGVFAGFLASVEAGRVHDAANEEPP